MKKSRVFWIILGITVLAALMQIAVESLFIAICLIAGGLLFAHREIWQLISRRKISPFDERVKENINKSIRNGFIFFVAALVFLVMPFMYELLQEPGINYLLGTLLLAGAAVYVFSYIYYEKAEPFLSSTWLKWQKAFIILCGCSAAAFVLGIFLHNAISGLFNFEDAVFFILGLIVAPAGFAIGVIGSLVVFLKGLIYHPRTKGQAG
jgi:Ca2+/Na+ antiporter